MIVVVPRANFLEGKAKFGFAALVGLVLVEFRVDKVCGMQVGRYGHRLAGLIFKYNRFPFFNGYCLYTVLWMRLSRARYLF